MLIESVVIVEYLSGKYSGPDNSLLPTSPTQLAKASLAVVHQVEFYAVLKWSYSPEQMVQYFDHTCDVAGPPLPGGVHGAVCTLLLQAPEAASGRGGAQGQAGVSAEGKLCHTHLPSSLVDFASACLTRLQLRI